jgi:hyaluronoglucosaminidase
VSDPILGVIEGFYGPPWSWSERERMVEFMGAHGFNTYVYAPKDDAMHRTSWRDLYLPEELTPFRQLAQRCDRLGIEFVYGISPIDIAGPDKADLAVLVEKAQQLQGLGVRSFSLLFDDLPGGLPDSDAGRAGVAHHQAQVARQLLRRLSAKGETRLIFTPTEYCCGSDSAYLRALGEELPAEIDVFWTGPQVCSHTISAADLHAVSRSLRRKPLLWDNYPVNDGEMRLDPHIRPYMGRSADLVDAVRGIVINGAIEAESSKIALHTVADYWSDPGAYEPDAAWTRALDELSQTPGGGAALRLLGELTRRSPLEPGAHRRQLPVFATFWEHWHLGARRSRLTAIARLRTELQEFAAAGELLRNGLRNRALRRNLEPWAHKLLTWCAASQQALDVLARALERPAPGVLDTERRATMTRLTTARRESHRVADRPFEAFVRRCLWEAAALTDGPDAVARLEKLVPEVVR